MSLRWFVHSLLRKPRRREGGGERAPCRLDRRGWMNQRIGQQVGTYRLLHVLGEGGFATVYLGEHVHLGTLAALKLLHVTFSSEDLEAFRREAQLIARLEHPHIVRVLDYDVQAGTPFLVLSFAPGGTLRSAHPKGTVLPLTKVVDYVAQVSEALQYAHDRGIIHRDVKPENLLVGARQEVLLGDLASQSSPSARGALVLRRWLERRPIWLRS